MLPTTAFKDKKLTGDFFCAISQARNKKIKICGEIGEI
jgi:hypothetical protein